jgi:hypothetical protein
MIVLSIVLWAIALVVLAGALAAAILASKSGRPRLALLSTIPIGLGLLGAIFGLRIAAPDHVVAMITALVIGMIGIIAGNPITVAVLNYADKGTGPKSVTNGVHGGIVVADWNAAEPEVHQPEVLRGGTTIGYVERLVVIAAVLLGRFEIVVVLIAIKGLGRFSELDSPETRERFIIGTLVSLVWAGACALLIII